MLWRRSTEHCAYSSSGILMFLQLNCPHSIWCRDLAGEIESKPRLALDDVLSLAHRLSAPFSNIKLIGFPGRRRWASKFRVARWRVEVVRAVTNPSRSGALINSRVGNRTSQPGDNFW